MMKHELEKQLDALEKKGVDRRHFFKLLAATGLIAGANTGKANAFSSSAKGKIVIIGGGAAFVRDLRTDYCLRPILFLLYKPCLGYRIKPVIYE